mgnify:CR=1 FL=1
MSTVQLAIEGMSCGGCVKRVTEGVIKAGAVPEEVKIGEARVRSTDDETTRKILFTLETMGFDARVVGTEGAS